MIACVLGWAVALAADLPGWRAAGPERGHVQDVAVADGRVLALTRPGVLSAPLSLNSWRRDARFPTNAKHLATAADGVAVWANTPESLFLVTDQPRFVAALPDGALVDMVGIPGGALIAIRGDAHGLYRVGEDGSTKQVLDDVDPWVLGVERSRILLGTLDHGLWASTDAGASFSNVVKEGAVSGIGIVGGEAIVAYSDGRITRGGVGEPLCKSAVGEPIFIGGVDGELHLVLDSPTGPRTNLYRCKAGGVMEKINDFPTQEDGIWLTPSGLWPLDEHRLLLGTFRTGPLLIDKTGARFVRDGFRGTLTSSVAVGETGELILALMSTGIYSTTTGAKAWESVVSSTLGRQAPVSDAMDVAMVGDKVLVVDFDGVSVGRGANWERSAGASVEGSGRQNALQEIGLAESGEYWGRDFSGGLWKRDGATWRQCYTGGFLRIEGSGKNLVFAMSDGYRSPGVCGEELPAIWPGMRRDLSWIRSNGVWAAGGGSLWRAGEAVARLSGASVDAIASRVVRGVEQVLVAATDGRLTRCIGGECTEAAQRLPGPVVAAGWFPDGRMWVAEERGTFLVADSRTSEGAFSTAVAFENRQSTRSGVGGPAAEATLGVPPWRGAGLANFSQKKVGGAPQSPNGEPLGSEPQPRGPRAAGGSAGQASAATGTSSADEGAPVVASDGGSSALVLALDGAAGVAVVLVFWKILRPSERQAPRRRRRRRGDG